MKIAQLTSGETRQMFLFVAGQIIEQQDILTQADRAIGDGDHGVGMARGFAAVRETLERGQFASLDGLLNAIGMALLTSIGGASGAVFGTLFRGGARALEDKESFDSAALAIFLQEGLAAVQSRGQARPGDKTMVDVLAVVAPLALSLASQPLSTALPALVPVAKQAVEDTKTMVAKVGKAKTLGERSLGHPDPGALSMCLIIAAMAAYLAAGPTG
jgi:dihydroxyacetone kinase-like protein